MNTFEKEIDDLIDYESDTVAFCEWVDKLTHDVAMAQGVPVDMIKCGHGESVLNAMAEYLNGEWNELDGAAEANLSSHALVRFFAYKEELRRDGHGWKDDAYDILSGFIWDSSEGEQSD